MRKILSMMPTSSVLACALLASTGTHAQTVTLVAEDFNDGETGLNGLVADTFSAAIVAAGGSGTWAAGSRFLRNGSVTAGVTATASQSASLNLGNFINNAKGTANGKFELTLTISPVTGASASWISLGFAVENTPNVSRNFTNTGSGGATNGSGTILYRSTTASAPGEIDMFGGPGNSNGFDGPDGNTGDRTLTVALDLTPTGGYNNLDNFGTVTWRDSQIPTALGSWTYTVATDFGSLLISETNVATSGSVSDLTLRQVRSGDPIIDLNGNGMCDVWEIRYHAQGLNPSHDIDGDGKTNLEESVAGTDPFRAYSRLSAEFHNPIDGDLQIRVATQPGKKYSLQHSETLAPDSWVTLPGSVVASGPEHVFSVLATAAGKGFYRAAADEQDSDNDGASDWVEGQLGYNPNNPNSFGAPQNDFVGVEEWITRLQAGNFTALVTSPVAIEKEGTLASITYSRSDLSRPFTFFFNTSGVEDLTKSSASPGSWRFKDAAGAEITGSLTIPAGVESVVLHVEAISNTLPQVPRFLSIGVNGSSTRTMVTLVDAANTDDNKRLLVASLTPRSGIDTLGSGRATIQLQGDNDASVIAVNFSNLSSSTTSTQLQTLSGAILQSVPPFAYSGQPWLIRATQSFATDQAVLDALLSGSLELNVFTENHSEGEISGQFQVVVGSPVFEQPPAPDAIATLTGVELDRDIVRFLSQATSGPTTADINSLRTAIDAKNGDRIAAYSEWIDAQIALPTTLMLPYSKAADQQRDSLLTNEATLFSGRNTRHGYWMLMRHAPDQLRKRVSFALHQILVTSMANPAVKNYSQGAAHYFDTLQAGAFGNYSALLNSVSLHPIMGEYLSHLKNQKEVRDSNDNIVAFPDENYAREIMQLFSIGLFELHPDGTLKLDAGGLPIPTYTQTDIAELARVFTGLSYAKYTSGRRSDGTAYPPSSENSQTNITDPANPLTTGFFRPERNPVYMRSNAAYVNPMIFFDEYRDQGSKNWLGITIPAGLTGPQNLDAVHNRLATHPSTAPFIATRLIQRMVTANPSRGYVYRVANAFAGGNGNLNNAIRAILLDPEARNPDVINSSVSVGRVRDPILRYMTFLRAFDVKSQLELEDLTTYGYPSTELVKFPAGTTRLRLRELDNLIEQSPYLAPSVFNWYRPDYSPPAGPLAQNGLVSPELQIHNEFTTFAQNNLLWTLINNPNGEAGEPIETPSAGITDPHAFKYTTLSDNLILNLVPFEAFYMGVVDTNGDLSFDAADATFNNPAAIRQACATVLDHVDLMLCAGALQTSATQTRTFILDAAQATDSATNNTNDATVQRDNMRRRIRTMLWLVTSSPTYIVTK